MLVLLACLVTNPCHHYCRLHLYLATLETLTVLEEVLEAPLQRIPDREEPRGEEDKLKAVHKSFANQAKKRFLCYSRLQVKI